VIDTVGIKIGPFAMVDWYGTPHTAALHVVERYRLIDDEAAKEAEERSARENVRLQGADFAFAANPKDKSNGPQLQFMVEDEGVFTTPWSATMTYRRPGWWPNGRNMPAPRTSNGTLERTPRCRLGTNRISKWRQTSGGVRRTAAAFTRRLPTLPFSVRVSQLALALQQGLGWTGSQKTRIAAMLMET
jgi:hypothetical protein